MTRATDLIPAPIRHLWQDAMDFIADVLDQFDRDGLRAGICRSTGARLAIWLNDVESALRRLILMAALVLTPAPLKRRSATQTQRPTTPRTHSFRVFRLHGSGTSRTPTWKPTREPQPYGHIRFPADPILALARVPIRRPSRHHNGGPLLPRPAPRNPLDRWVRLSRNDPDWRPPPETDFVDTSGEWSDLELEFDDWDDLDGFDSDDKPRRKRNKPKRLDSTADWHRCYDEWEKLVPAPNLAARLDALGRLAANPAALIHRTARRLSSHRERTLALARAARPATRLPRRAQRVENTDITFGLATPSHNAFDSS